jgi:hypothetical protein
MSSGEVITDGGSYESAPKMESAPMATGAGCINCQ